MSLDKLADNKLKKYGMCPHFILKYGSKPPVEKCCSEAVHTLSCVHVLYSMCLGVCQHLSCLFELSVRVAADTGTGRNITPLMEGYTPASLTCSHTCASLTSQKRSSMWDWHSCHMFRREKLFISALRGHFSLLNHGIGTQTSWHCYVLRHTLSLEM